MEVISPSLCILKLKCLWELERGCQVDRWIYELKYLAWIYKFVLHLPMGIAEVVSIDDI